MSQQNYKDGTVKKPNVGDCIYFIRKLRHYALRADEAIFETESGQPDPSALERMQEVTRFYEQIENYAKQLPPNVAGAMEKMDLLKSIYQEEQNDLNTHELVESFIDTTNWTECIFTRYVYLTEFHRYRPYSRKTTAMIPKHLPYSNWGAEDANKHPHKLFEAAFAQLQLDLKNMKPRSGIVPTYLEQNSMSSIIELKFGFFCPTQKNTFICSQKMLLVEEFGYFESLQFIAPHEEWAYNEEMGEKRVDLTKESQYLIFRKLTIQGNVQLTHTIHPYLTSNAMKNLFMQLGKYQEVFRAQCKYCRKHMKDFMPPYVVLAAKQTQFDFAHETCKSRTIHLKRPHPGAPLGHKSPPKVIPSCVMSQTADECKKQIVSSRSVARHVQKFRAKMMETAGYLKTLNATVDRKGLIKKLTKEFDQLQATLSDLPNIFPTDIVNSFFTNVQLAENEPEYKSQINQFFEQLMWHDRNLMFYAFSLNEMHEAGIVTEKKAPISIKQPLRPKVVISAAHERFQKIFQLVSSIEFFEARRHLQISYLAKNFQPSTSVAELRCGTFFRGSFIPRLRILMLVIDGELHYVNFIGGHENWPIDDDCWGNRLNITYESRYHVYKSLTIRANELLNKLSDSSFSTNPNDMAKMNYTLAKFGDVFYNTCTGCQKVMKNFCPPTIVNIIGNKTIYRHEQCL
ncbi:unnamed protein product, partial [Mesorhabditis belari]|uniref:Uncharacterized protein n=1 Tax=Mesorhabditis belari TaxID=2138241 RepID=A0AAF3F736_9BILA